MTHSTVNNIMRTTSAAPPNAQHRFAVSRSCRFGSTKALSWLICAVSLSAFSGCAQLNVTWDDMVPWNFGKDEEVEQPTRITVVWTDSVMSRSGETPQRGFGGRLMFYGNLSEDPVKVDGQLVIYMFDETERDPENCVPDRRVIMTAEQFRNHYSKSSVGHSYSVWAPWAKVGGYRKQVSLVARFEPIGGSPIMSELTQQVLPGPSPPETPKVETTLGAGNAPAGQVLPATYTAQQAANTTHDGMFPAVEMAASARRMQTSTITIPPSWVATEPQVVDSSTAPVNPPVQQRYLPNPQTARVASSPMGAVVPPAGQTHLPGATAIGANRTMEPQEIIDQRQAWEAYRQGGWEAYRNLRQAEALGAAARPLSSIRSVPRRHQLPAASIAQPRLAHAPTRPHPQGWPSGHASSPTRVPLADQNAAGTARQQVVR